MNMSTKTCNRPSQRKALPAGHPLSPAIPKRMASSITRSRLPACTAVPRAPRVWRDRRMCASIIDPGGRPDLRRKRLGGGDSLPSCGAQ
jgi:hypothetical protein